LLAIEIESVSCPALAFTWQKRWRGLKIESDASRSVEAFTSKSQKGLSGPSYHTSSKKSESAPAKNIFQRGRLYFLISNFLVSVGICVSLRCPSACPVLGQRAEKFFDSILSSSLPFLRSSPHFAAFVFNLYSAPSRSVGRTPICLSRLALHLHATRQKRQPTNHLNLLQKNRSKLFYNFFHLLCARPGCAPRPIQF